MPRGLLWVYPAACGKSRHRPSPACAAAFVRGASWFVFEAYWAILAALVASQVRIGSRLRHLGRFGKRRGRAWAPTEPREEKAIHVREVRRGEGGALRILLGILARLSVPWGTVADSSFTCPCPPAPSPAGNPRVQVLMEAATRNLGTARHGITQHAKCAFAGEGSRRRRRRR